ncbi:unnamed protein product [Absidia cylindrospora]
MLSNDREAIQAAAFVEWINTCPTISHPCNNINDLDNGILLFEVLAEIDSVWFKLIRSADIGENWVLKVNNLKKMYHMVSRYYEEVLGIPFDKMPKVSLTAIAKDSNIQEIFKLCQLVLFITVERENNAMVVERLQRLSEQSQRVVMDFIEQINAIRLASTGQSHLQPTASSSSLAGGNGDRTPRSSYADDALYRNHSDVSRMAAEQQKLEASQRTLIEEHAQLRYKYDELENEKDDLQIRLQEMDKAVTQANETGRADFIMRTEIEHLKQDLQKSEDRRLEAEMLLEQQSITIEDLTRKSEELKRHIDESAMLKDELDEYRHVMEKLHKAENTLEKCKKKMEDSGDLKRQIKALDDQNHGLMERNQQIENEYRKVLALETLVDSYKDQVAMLETKNNELVREKNKMEYYMQQITNKMELLEADKSRDSERILDLEEQVQDAQLGMGQPLSESLERGNTVNDMDLDDDDDMHLDNSLEDSLKESNVTELKLSKRWLEHQVRTLQEGGAAEKNQKALVLQHLLDDANRLKNQFEKNYIEVSHERDILQSDMARVREGIPDSILKDSQHTMSLRLHIIDLEKESKQLREDMNRLEQKMADSTHLADHGDTSDNLDYQTQYKRLQEKAIELEEETKKQLQDFNKLLLERDMLQNQYGDQKDSLKENEQFYSELKSSLAVFEGKDDEPLKQQNAQLQQKVLVQKEQIREAQNKLKKSEEFAFQQDKLLKESRQSDTGGHCNEAVTTLEAKLLTSDEEMDRIKKQIMKLDYSLGVNNSL